MCVVIHGFMKSSAYKIGQNVAANKVNLYGEWNAILVQNVWRHVNAYWGACAVTSEGENIEESTTFSLDETFFIPDPETLAYTHFPDEPKWQLLERPMSMKDFEKRAFIKERFFELDMRILSHPECEIVCHDQIEILFGIPPDRIKNVKLMCLLSVENEEEDWVPMEEDPFKQHDFAHAPNDSSIAVQVRFPERGTYKLEILGKDLLQEREDEKYGYDWLAIYKIYVKNVGKKTAYPKCDVEAGWGPGLLMDEAGLTAVGQKTAILNADGGYLDVVIQCDDVDACQDSEIFYKMASLEASLEDTEFSQEGVLKENNRFIIFHDKAPANEYSLCVYLESTEEPDFLLSFMAQPGEVVEPTIVRKNVCNFLVRCTSLSSDSKFRDIDNARKGKTDTDKLLQSHICLFYS